MILYKENRSISTEPLKYLDNLEHRRSRGVQFACIAQQLLINQLLCENCHFPPLGNLNLMRMDDGFILYACAWGNLLNHHVEYVRIE